MINSLKYHHYISFSSVGLVLLFGAFLMSSYSHATDGSTVDNVSINVPVSCTMSGTGMNSHNASIVNGTYQADIGTTTIKAFCNDTNGFAIYATGYTENETGGTNSNKLVGVSTNQTIKSGTAISGDTSNWAMKLSTDSGATYPLTLDNSFGSYSAIPNSYAKVAHRASATDVGANATGSTLTTTYAAYMSNTQAADTYVGKVIYTLVHPNDHRVPATYPAILDTGRIVNAKLKSLAATVVNGVETTVTPDFDPENSSYDWDYAYDEYIKSIIVHLETTAPNDFIATTANTISSSNSSKPIYIIFDNADDTGVMHFYTEGDRIVLPSDSSYMFYMFNKLTGISGIDDWDTSNVTDMSNMFYYTGSYAETFALDLSSWDTSSVTDMSKMFRSAGFSSESSFTLDLSSWDTSNVADMSGMFNYAGQYATTWSIGGLSSWDTSSVTDMSHMFDETGESTATFTLDLSSWNTSNVTDMSFMFFSDGRNATTWSIGDLSSWDTSSVTDMSYMFRDAGHKVTTWSIGDLSSWDTSSVTDMSHMFADTGYSATTWSIGDISAWNTSSVTNMIEMFSYAGRSITTFTLDLSSWDTSNVEYMSYIFYSAGYSATTFTLDLSSWDTSNATDMGLMFLNAGRNATTWSVAIPQTNGGGISNTTSRIYGKTTSQFGTPPSGRSFTLAQQ